MATIESLHKSVDRIIAAIETRRLAQAENQRVVMRLPIKDDEPPIEYQRGPIYFYIPEHRRGEL